MGRSHRACRTVLVLVGWSVAATLHGAEGIEAPPSAEQVAQWVRQLDDESFVVRQAASQSLCKAGTPAIAAVVEAAAGRSLEVTHRAVRVLFELASSEETAAANAGMEALAKLAASGHREASIRARSALISYQLRITTLLERCGASFATRGDAIVGVDFDGVSELGPTQLRLLHALPDLESLSFSTPLFDDRGMAELRGLPKVYNLNLYRSRVGDDGLKHLKTLPSLRRVPMGETLVTDKGLVHLKELTNLDYIGLRANQITDAGLIELRGLTNLKGLHIGETKLTDAGLEHLKDLTQLEFLYVWDTGVTETGAARLKESLPELLIRLKQE